MEYNAVLGDIFLCDSDRTGAKIVKFFMQSPTAVQQLWRYMTNTLQPVRYYHAGMVLSDTQMIEQQSKVQYGDTQKILSRRITIYRKKNLSDEQKILLKERAIASLGKGYGIGEIMGKFLRWLTGIYWFEYIFGVLTREGEICDNRVGQYYNHICEFGVKNYLMLTTKIIDDYCQKHVEEWSNVYEN
jgi:hypothetical protein